MIQDTERQCDLRAEIRFKNGALLRALTDSLEGLAKKYSAEVNNGHGVVPLITVAALVSGVKRNAIYGWANLTTSPYLSRKIGHPLTRSAQRFCESLGFDPEVVFPRSLYGLKIPKLIIREFYSEDVVSLQEAAKTVFLLPEGEQEVLKQERAKAIDKALLTLSPREAKIICLKFGLGGQPDHTMREIAEEFGVTQSRIGKIEDRAMRQLMRSGGLQHLRP